MGGYKLLHSGGDGRSNGVGIIVSEEISKTVVRVERWKGRIVMAWLIIRKQLMCVMSVYGPQTGRMEAEKEEFRDALERMIGLVELEVMLCIAGDFNAHVGVVEPGEEESVGRYGWGARNRASSSYGRLRIVKLWLESMSRHSTSQWCSLCVCRRRNKLRLWAAGQLSGGGAKTTSLLNTRSG